MSANQPQETIMNRLIILAVCLALAACPGSATTGIVTVLSEGPCAGSAEWCIDLEVACDDVARPAPATLRVFDHPGRGYSGVVTFASGGAGQGVWDGGLPSALGALDELRAAGHATIQVQWGDGWTRGTEGVGALGCRPALLWDWIRAEWPWGPLCAVGNSGGSAQIAYGLAWHDAGDVLDLAVMTSGPPMSRLDLGCSAGPYWLGEESRIIDAAYGCRPAVEDCPCEVQDPSWQETFAADSIVSETSSYLYPDTELAFLRGGQDGGVSPLQADEYLAELDLAGQGYAFVELPGTGHTIQATQEGADEIVVQVLVGCRGAP